MNQAELVWFIINSIDGRVFVCGSTKGMGEGVEAALVQVAMEKGQLRKSEAEEFWQKKKDSYQYITVSITLKMIFALRIHANLKIRKHGKKVQCLNAQIFI